MNAVVEEKLDLLADLMAQKDALNLAKQELIDQVLTPEIRQQIADIEAEFAGKSEKVDTNIAYLTDLIKRDVIESGSSVKGQYLHAVYVKGRTSWDSKKLEGLAIAIPDILKAQKIGDPSVTIRKAA